MTDSACSLPGELVERWDVELVPMWLTLGSRQYRDGQLSLAEVVSGLGRGLSTSGPAPGEFAAAMRAADRGDGVAVLTLSRRMSSSYQAARVAAGLSDAAARDGGEGPDAYGGQGHFAVVDTGTAAGAQGLVVLAAARAAKAGLPLARVVEQAERASLAAKLFATLPSLDDLARGGRVPGAAAWAGRWLGLHPLFEFRSGKVKPLRPALGRRQAHDRIISIWERGLERGLAGGASLHVAALHALEPEVADELLDRVRQRIEPATAFSGPFSTVMVAHTGPGLVGLAWWWEHPANSY